MTDTYASHANSLTAPARDGFAITPNDAADITAVTRAVYVGGPGNLAIVLQSGATVTLSNVASGSLLPLRIKRLLATGTTATSIVGLL
jgi:hypothetical protein